MRFGTHDEISCLTGPIPGPHDTSVCLASKISTHWFGLGVHVSDGGYVLKVVDSKIYYELDQHARELLQKKHIVPSPWPAYRITTEQYMEGYSLWGVLACGLLVLGLSTLFGRRRRFMRADVEPSAGPPAVKTAQDRWLDRELRNHLEPDEKIEHQAQVASYDVETRRRGREPRYLALTDRRLLYFDAQVDRLRIGKELKKLVDRARADVAAVGQDGPHIGFRLTDGSELHIWVTESRRKFSNQWLFARDAAKLVAREVERRRDTAA